MSRLNFIVTSDFLIEYFSSENMDYDLSPDNFVNKDIRLVLNLDEPYKTRVLEAFTNAEKSNVTVEVKYVLKETEYMAEITPLTNIKLNRSYFVKVVCAAQIITMTQNYYISTPKGKICFIASDISTLKFDVEESKNDKKDALINYLAEKYGDCKVTTLISENKKHNYEGWVLVVDSAAVYMEYIIYTAKH